MLNLHMVLLALSQGCFYFTPTFSVKPGHVDGTYRMTDRNGKESVVASWMVEILLSIHFSAIINIGADEGFLLDGERSKRLRIQKYHNLRRREIALAWMMRANELRCAIARAAYDNSVVYTTGDFAEDLNAVFG